MRKKLSGFLFILILLSSATTSVWANGESDKGFGCGEGFPIFSQLFCKDDTTPVAVANRLNTTLSGVLGFMTIIAGLWFMIQFILAGYAWISAAGDKSKLEGAKNKLLYSILGLVIVVGAWAIVGVIAKIVGLEILNPGEVLLKLHI